MKSKLLSIITVLTLAISLCACTSNTSVDDETNVYRNVTLSDEESEQLLNEILHFIENTGSGKELYMFADDLSISTDDIVTGVGVKSVKYYVSGNAAYLQIDNLMYRFQFNNDNVVVSYIKYTVEA